MKITVDSGTSLQKLQQFTDQVGDKAKIRGKVNDDGSVTLYTSKKINTGFKELFFGHVTKRQEGAREALDKIIGNIVKDPHVGEGAKLLLTDIAKPGGEIRGGSLKQFMEEVKQARDTGLSLENRLSEAIESNNQGTIDTLRNEMVGNLSEQLKETSKEDQMKFAMSNGEDYKNTVSTILNKHLDGGPFGESYDKCSEGAKQFLDDLHSGIAQNLSGRYMNDKQFELDGKTYTFDKHMGEGGQGIVDLYKSGEESIVVKRTVGDEKTNFESYSGEAREHLNAMKVGGDKVIEMKGVIRTPEGGLRIALKLAPGGDANKVLEGINNLVKEGLITPDQAQAMHTTMLKDMLESLQTVHGGHILHQDLKPMNYFIDEGGIAKMGDFGTAKIGDQVEQKTRAVDTCYWLAPEVLNGFEKNQVFSDINKARNLTPLSEIRNMLKDTIKDETELDSTMSKIQKNRQDRVKDLSVTVGQKSDTWGLGVTAHQMFYGAMHLGIDNPDLKFAFERDNLVMDFGKNKEVLFKPQDGIELTDEQRLINDLMHPDPEKRSSPEQALNSPLFQKEGVGSNEIRELLTNPLLRKDIKDLTDEDRNKILEISNNLSI